MADKKKYHIIIFLAAALLYSACTEPFDLGYDESAYSIVVEGLITNESGPYYVRLTKSSPNFTFNQTYNIYDDGAIPIHDAIVVVYDNTGVYDTLVPSPKTKTYYSYYYDTIKNEFDSIPFEDYYAQSSDFGYYQTTKIEGVAGMTYFLKVLFENKEIEAECYMPTVPEIDSMDIEEIVVKEADGTKAWVPIVYFKEPQNEKNFYLFNIGGGINNWSYSILEDRYLESYVNGLNVDDGEHPDWWATNYPYGIPEGTMKVSMQSLTEEGFEYYRGLIEQFNNDGGIYSPTPTSPINNLSSGALGFFRASAITSISKTYGF
jgi:hypothetical protein